MARAPCAIIGSSFWLNIRLSIKQFHYIIEYVDDNLLTYVLVAAR